MQVRFNKLKTRYLVLGSTDITIVNTLNYTTHLLSIFNIYLFLDHY